MPTSQTNDNILLQIKGKIIYKFKPKLNKTWIVHTHTNEHKHTYIYIYIYIHKKIISKK